VAFSVALACGRNGFCQVIFRSVPQKLGPQGT
jgi:hypothetical protein